MNNALKKIQSHSVEIIMMLILVCIATTSVVLFLFINVNKKLDEVILEQEDLYSEVSKIPKTNNNYYGELEEINDELDFISDRVEDIWSIL